MSTNQTSNEEVDLGSLFKVIGKGFKNLFIEIGKFFSKVFHYFVVLLLFIRNNALKLGLAILIGAIAGLVLDLTQPPKYFSKMIVEPNFKSAQQLYNNISFYDELVDQKDFTLLSETLNISLDEAKNLKEFKIKPIKNDNEKYELFDDFIETIDTATIRKINIREFKNNFTNFDYKYHEITVVSLSGSVFEKLGTPIINSIESNSYFKNQKRINDANLLQNEQVLVKSLKEVDTLRRIYNEVLITEARKTETGTNITLAQGVKKTEEIELFNESLKLNEELIDNNKERAETTEILNIVSTFNKLGIKERSILKKKTFLLATGTGLVMLIYILLLQLNAFLLNYKK